MLNSANTSLRTSYRPELDVSPVLDPQLSAYYMSLVGILRWIVELGRVDICLEVSMISSHMAMPREGHLEGLLHIFSYLKKFHNTELVLDPSDTALDYSDFDRKDWTSSKFGYVQGEEQVPPKMLQARALGFIIYALVDADSPSDTVTRQSRTGFLVYLNSSLTYWFSKKQISVESSTFGSEFIAMNQ